MKYGNKNLYTADKSYIEFYPKYTDFAVNKTGLLPLAERNYFPDNGLLTEAEQHYAVSTLHATRGPDGVSRCRIFFADLTVPGEFNYH